MVADPGQFRGDGLRRQDEIHAATVDGMLGHVGVLGAVFILGEGDPPCPLDFGQSCRAVTTGAGEKYADGPFLPIGSQRAQEAVNGQMRHGGPVSRRELQLPPLDGHAGVGGDDIDMVGLDHRGALDLCDGNGHVASEKGRKLAFVHRIEMLDEHESHACVRGNVLQELPERFQATCGGANANYREDHVRTSLSRRGDARFGDFASDIALLLLAGHEPTRLSDRITIVSFILNYNSFGARATRQAQAHYS